MKAGKTATSGDDAIGHTRQLLNDVMLFEAKLLFAYAVEHIYDTLSKSTLNEDVCINKVKA